MKVYFRLTLHTHRAWPVVLCSLWSHRDTGCGAAPQMFLSTAPKEGKGALKALHPAFEYFRLKGKQITSTPSSLATISHMVPPTEETRGYQPTVYPEGNELEIVNSSDGCYTMNKFNAESIFKVTNRRKHSLRL